MLWVFKIRSKRLSVLITYLERLCDYCKPHGISVAVETLKPRCLGKGINDWKAITSLMAERGYKGPWVFEVSFENDPPKAEEYSELVNLWNEILQ